MSNPLPEQVNTWHEQIKEKPWTYEKICSRHKLTQNKLDRLIFENTDLDKETVSKYEKTLVIRYGLYPKYLSLLTLEQMVQDAKLPRVPTYYAALKVGTAEEIIDILRIPKFEIYNSIYTCDHFCRHFKINDRPSFFRVYSKNNGNLAATCKDFDIDIKKAYIEMSLETEKVNKENAFISHQPVKE